MSAWHRLSRLDFAHMKAVRRVGGVHMSLSLYTVSGGEHPKVACVVSKKTLRRAVDRNRVKRRIRSLMREVVVKLPPPLALVAYPKPEALHAPLQELRTEMGALIERLNILPPSERH